MFQGYSADKFFDEMFSSDGTVRDHCEPLHQKFKNFDKDDFLARKATSELYFMRQGITFNVYGDDKGTEKIFLSILSRASFPQTSGSISKQASPSGSLP